MCVGKGGVSHPIQAAVWGNGRVSTIKILIGKGLDIKKKDAVSMIMIKLDLEPLRYMISQNKQ